MGVEGYIDIQKVKLCRIVDNKEFWKRKRVWIRIDLLETDDNTPVIMVTEEEDIVYTKIFGFVPSEKVEYKSKKEYVDYNWKQMYYPVLL